MLGVKRIERVLPTGTSLTVVGEVCNVDSYYLDGSITYHFISPRLIGFTYIKDLYVENNQMLFKQQLAGFFLQ